MALGAAFAKLKGLSLLLFHLPMLLGSASFLLTLWLYGLAFGWRFGIILALVLLGHELGHVLAFKSYGLAVRAPIFLPFMGALTAGAMPQSLEEDAYIALAGPLAGLMLAALCYSMALATGDPFWLLATNISVVLNLFNLIPVVPLDGGRIIHAIWPPVVLVGVPLFFVVAFLAKLPLLPLILIALLSIPWLIDALRGRIDPRAASMSRMARVRVGLAYCGTLLGLLFFEARIHLPSLLALHR
ncbi:MAG TPA: site-2 protease family protein [Candidatus Dormibacteraeota bacterium]|nr:site-2 protease family protein [Candidatus Dormibacteraeota bacterium]